MDSPIGPLLLIGDGEALSGLHMQTRAHPPPESDLQRPNPLGFRQAREQLAAYFAGELREFSIALRPRGTPFQKRVWEALKALPYGTTESYAGLAEKMGSPQACRAVGAANGRNPISIIVPCHRVIGADGKLVGFGGGMDTKVWLLEHESIDPRSVKNPDQMNLFG